MTLFSCDNVSWLSEKTWLAIVDKVYSYIEDSFNVTQSLSDQFILDSLVLSAEMQQILDELALLGKLQSIEIRIVDTKVIESSDCGDELDRANICDNGTYVLTLSESLWPDHYLLEARSLALLVKNKPGEKVTSEQLSVSRALLEHINTAVFCYLSLFGGSSEFNPSVESLNSENDATDSRVLPEKEQLVVNVMPEIADSVGLSKQANGLIKPNVQLANFLADKYNLTDSEIILACNIYHGIALKQYAFIFEKSIETVRVQLKSIFKKMGVTDQKEVCLVVHKIVKGFVFCRAYSLGLNVKSSGIYLSKQVV